MIGVSCTENSNGLPKDGAFITTNCTFPPFLWPAGPSL